MSSPAIARTKVTLHATASAPLRGLSETHNGQENHEIVPLLVIVALTLRRGWWWWSGCGGIADFAIPTPLAGLNNFGNIWVCWVCKFWGFDIEMGVRPGVSVDGDL